MQSSRSSEDLRKAIPVSLLSGGFDRQSELHARYVMGHRSLVGVISTGSSRGQLLPGVDKVAARLADQAGEAETWRPLITELAGVEWNVPRGLTVREVTLMLPGDSDRDLPTPPTGLTRVLAVSPFLDGQTVKSLEPGRHRSAPCSPRSPSSGV